MFLPRVVPARNRLQVWDNSHFVLRRLHTRSEDFLNFHFVAPRRLLALAVVFLFLTLICEGHREPPTVRGRPLFDPLALDRKDWLERFDELVLFVVLRLICDEVRIRYGLDVDRGRQPLPERRDEELGELDVRRQLPQAEEVDGNLVSGVLLGFDRQPVVGADLIRTVLLVEQTCGHVFDVHVQRITHCKQHAWSLPPRRVDATDASIVGGYSRHVQGTPRRLVHGVQIQLVARATPLRVEDLWTFGDDNAHLYQLRSQIRQVNSQGFGQ
mmetsp:Transcript_100350/g.283077  ORF Transcript_100350/g.283077 Transcript_100350/m.283077 type:complete len:270 (-) Transcript_100350:1381-2190(-)